MPTLKPSPKHNILIVDDDPDIRGLLGHVFARDYQVISAGAGAQAIGLFKKHKPHLVMLDMNLPDMTGTDVLRSILACDRQALVVMLSSAFYLQQARDSIDQGAAGYVCKPFNCDQLRDVIRATLRTSPPQPGEPR